MRSKTPLSLVVMLLPSAVLLAACASVPTPPPTGALSKAEYAITQASQAVGPNSQSTALDEAKRRYGQAQSLVANPKATEEDYTRARWLAEEATLDANLAQAQAQAQQTQAQKTNLQESFEKVRNELHGKEAK
ncbi:MAG TPA: DUF4398 domain-containing protein [Nitrococcus sp.]|nr:DUF4398 domain-containing protein [Nitrococcus sp.]